MSGSNPGYILVTDVPFEGYERGDQISDPTAISNVQGTDNSRYVVRTLTGQVAPPPPVSTTPPPNYGTYYTLPIASYNTLGGILVGSGLSIDSNSGLLSVSYSYTLPMASPTLLGGMKVGNGLTVSGDGTVSVVVNNTSGATALSGLTDVHETAPASGQYLGYNGTQWVNVTPPTVPTTLSALTNDVGYLTSVPVASTTATGVVKVGSGLSVTGTGVLSTVPMTVPNAGLLGGDGTNLAAVTLGAGLALASGTLSVSYAYTLPPATTIALGGVKVGNGLQVAGDGTLAVISVGGGSGSLTVKSQQTTGISVPSGSGSFRDVELFTPAQGDNQDVWVGSIQFKAADNVGGKFTYEIWSGTPHGAGTLIVPVGSTLTLNTSSPSAFAGSAYIPASLGSNAVWVRLINSASSPLNVNAQVNYTEVPASIPLLPGYTPPPPYTGSPLAVVNVGPGQQFSDLSTGILALAPNGTMNVYNGTYYTPIDVPPTLTGVTIKAVNRGGVTLDGRGGVGGGFPLAWGKAFIHTRAPCVIDGFRFINCGGGDNYSDGECAVYPENFANPGTLTVQYCHFDANENGIFAPGPTTTGGNVSIVVQYCDFGYTNSNGVCTDGRSHDMYLQCANVTVQNCNFYSGGNPGYGNCLKSRALNTTVSNCYIAHNNGRCIDTPEGGHVSVSGCTLTAIPGAIANFYEYASENTNQGVFNASFNNCTLIGTRYNDTIWIQPAGSVCSFTNTTQSWYNPNNTPPSFTVTGNGSVTGLALNPPNGAVLSSTPPAAPTTASGY